MDGAGQAASDVQPFQVEQIVDQYNHDHLLRMVTNDKMMHVLCFLVMMMMMPRSHLDHQLAIGRDNIRMEKITKRRKLRALTFDHRSGLNVSGSSQKAGNRPITPGDIITRVPPGIV
jgi:hypothetical protein